MDRYTAEFEARVQRECVKMAQARRDKEAHDAASIRACAGIPDPERAIPAMGAALEFTSRIIEQLIEPSEHVGAADVVLAQVRDALALVEGGGG